jgi:hypothetical protein
VAMPLGVVVQLRCSERCALEQLASEGDVCVIELK